MGMQSPQKIEGIRGIVLAAENHVAGLNAVAFAGRRDAFVDKPDAFEIIMDGEWFEQLFAMAIADESHMLIAGKVDRDDQDALERRLGEKFPQLRTLILINGFSFHRR